MRLFLRAARLVLGVVVAAWATPACYNAGGGTAPPTASFYFPTGLAVSRGGHVLYAINSDFDLQWSGGTLQSYDLFQLRHDVAELIQANLSGATSPPPGIPFLQPWQPNCPTSPPPPLANGNGVYPGQACAPPVDSTQYIRDSVIVGAFATDLQLSSVTGTRLFAPVAGNATVTWADVAADDPGTAPAEGTGAASSFAPFAIDCGVRSEGRCDDAHKTGDDPNSVMNTRNATMAGEPFGLAQTEDGTAMAVTSETDTKTSILTTGLGASAFYPQPTMQFVVDGLPAGGVGIAAIPHDPLAVRRCEDVGNQPPCVRQAFLETFRDANEVDLLRYYDDDGSSLHRPFLQKEVAFPVTANSGGSDSRGIAIDPTPRLLCEAGASSDDEKVACARKGARVFIANRTPSTVITGTVGQWLPNGKDYDPDALVLTGNTPVLDGPSKVYVAPIVDASGHYAIRLFVVCFDSNSLWIFDPDDMSAPEQIVHTGPGPYALAFDPFSLEEVAKQIAKGAQGDQVPVDPLQPPELALKRYRFAYLTSFTQSFMQVIDLDQSSPTYGSVVFTLGMPTLPKGQ